MKFKYLKIDFESNTYYCCHAAQPHSIDKNWLQNHTGQLFNTPLLLKERTMMLNNQRNSSCEQNCWPAEDKGALSPRLQQSGQIKTHKTVNVQPEQIDMTLTSECNLTCSYCTKEYSSAWKKDLLDNGDYNLGDRYTLTNQDKIIYKLSHKEKVNSTHYQFLVNETKKILSNVKELTITGGEPFLNNQLLKIIENSKLCDKIIIYTGLGVSNSRFKKILNKLKLYTNIEIRVSAENVGKYLEFNRYGIDANDFLQKIKLIQDEGLKYKFHLTLTNLTIFGLPDFYRQFNTSNLIVTFAYQPDFMAVNVLDDKSKENLLQELKILPEIHYNNIVKSIAKTPTATQKNKLKIFFNEFSARRNLDLNIYPTNFTDWINT